MKNRLGFCLVAGLVMGGFASAVEARDNKIAYQEARSLYNEFGKTLSAAGLWDKKSPADRALWYRAAEQNKRRIDRGFGELSACGKTALSHLDFLVELNQMAFAEQGGLKVAARPRIAALAAAERFGNHRAACYDEVEALDTGAVK